MVHCAIPPGPFRSGCFDFGTNLKLLLVPSSSANASTGEYSHLRALRASLSCLLAMALPTVALFLLSAAQARVEPRAAWQLRASALFTAMISSSHLLGWAHEVSLPVHSHLLQGPHLPGLAAVPEWMCQLPHSSCLCPHPWRLVNQNLSSTSQSNCGLVQGHVW